MWLKQDRELARTATAVTPERGDDSVERGSAGPRARDLLLPHAVEVDVQLDLGRSSFRNQLLWRSRCAGQREYTRGAQLIDAAEPEDPERGGVGVQEGAVGVEYHDPARSRLEEGCHIPIRVHRRGPGFSRRCDVPETDHDP